MEEFLSICLLVLCFVATIYAILSTKAGFIDSIGVKRARGYHYTPLKLKIISYSQICLVLLGWVYIFYSTVLSFLWYAPGDKVINSLIGGVFLALVTLSKLEKSDKFKAYHDEIEEGLTQEAKETRERFEKWKKDKAKKLND